MTTLTLVGRHYLMCLNDLFLIFLELKFELSQVLLKIHFIICDTPLWVLLNHLLVLLDELWRLDIFLRFFFLDGLRIIIIVFLSKLNWDLRVRRRKWIICVLRWLSYEPVTLLIGIVWERRLDHFIVWISCHLSSLPIITSIRLRIVVLFISLLIFLILIQIHWLVVILPFDWLVFCRAILSTIVDTQIESRCHSGFFVNHWLCLLS